jgi:cytidine deaminase
MPTIDQAALDRLRTAAESAAVYAYAPYSKFRVGAALLFEDGSVFAGCNVENAAYSLTSCAERNALFRSISERGPEPRITAIAVINLNQSASPPCGACLQVLSEFVTSNAIIHFASSNGFETRPFSEVFPIAFNLSAR